MFKQMRLGMVKTITIGDEVYGRLVSIKRDNESFSDLLDRLIKTATPTGILIRLRGRVEFRDKEKTVSEIRSKRDERRV